MKTRLAPIFLSLFFIAILPLTAESRELSAVLAAISAKAAAVNTVSSGFVQEKRLSMFDTTVVSDGRFLFAKPDRLLWEYRSPMIEGFALSGDRGVRWTDAPGSRQEFSLRSDPVMNIVARQLLAWATFDLAWLEEQYSIVLENPQPVILRLTPKRQGEAEVLQYLLIEFSASEDTVRRVELHEGSGDFTRIVFTNATVNSPLDDSLFR